MPRRSFRKARAFWLSPRRWVRRLVFWGGAVAVGGAAVLFAKGADAAALLFRQMAAVSPYLPLLVTPLGLAGVVWATGRFFPGSQGSGIPQSIAALWHDDETGRSRMLSLRIAVGKIGLTLLALACGASVGREGPTVQIGASIMHSLGRFARFSRHDVQQGLILAGGAAGVAAAFNTPLAGVVFAIEEMSRTFQHRTSGTLTAGVIVAGLVSLALMGNYAYFGHTAATLPLETGWLAVLVCGVGGGLIGGLFSRTLIAASRGLPGKLGIIAKTRPVAFAALCGLALAVIGVASGNLAYGTGYPEARLIVEESGHLPAWYGLAKLLATVASYFSGTPGGIFAPSLAIGAGLGQNAASILPSVPLSAVVLLGMVGYFSGVVQAPITAFVIVMEMTDNHGMIIPLMATAFLANAVSRLVCHKSLYKALAEGFLARIQAASGPR